MALARLRVDVGQMSEVKCKLQLLTGLFFVSVSRVVWQWEQISDQIVALRHVIATQCLTLNHLQIPGHCLLSLLSKPQKSYWNIGVKAGSKTPARGEKKKKTGRDPYGFSLLAVGHRLLCRLPTQTLGFGSAEAFQVSGPQTSLWGVENGFPATSPPRPFKRLLKLQVIFSPENSHRGRFFFHR